MTWMKVDPLPSWDQECSHILRLDVVAESVLSQVHHKWNRPQAGCRKISEFRNLSNVN